MNHGIKFARSQAIAIASDRVAHLDQDAKDAILKLIDLALERAGVAGSNVLDQPPTGLFGTPIVPCRADQFTKLWGEQYEPAVRITSTPGIGLDVSLALLVERDGESMPVESIANALRYIWIAVWETAKVYRQLLVEQDAAQMTK
jgi:hypothetical protein